MTSLTQRLILPFLAFVVAGSIALVMWMLAQERRESQALFAEIARTNAEFIRAQNLALSDRTAQGLAEVLDTEVQFYRPNRDPAWIPGDRFVLAEQLGKPAGPQIRPGVQVIAEAWEMAAAEVHPGEWLVLVRKPTHHRGIPWNTLPALLAFWVLSLALAWALARGIVRPLRAFAEQLPRIADAATPADFPETARPDEIGQLARSYRETHAQLIAERKAREETERLATLGRMTTGMAHEINNPVAAIKLHTQLLQGEAAPAHRERLEIILGECARIESLVSQWMFLARPQPPQTSSCVLAEVVNAAESTHRPAAEYAGVRILNEVSPEHLVRADERRIRQAVANVLTNAIHAMAGGGGSLRIASRRANGEKMVWLEFHDTGRGFSPEALKHATELFYSEKEGGMGVGLSVTAEILRAHGGELRLANDPAGGAVVTFVLPAEPSTPTSAK